MHALGRQRGGFQDGTARAIALAMVKHTHCVQIEKAAYSDTFMFTPSSPAAVESEVAERVQLERGAGFKITVVELKSADETRARGTLVTRVTEGRTRRFYEV